jgi:peptidyl serine alpha-galactosyltransferase
MIRRRAAHKDDDDDRNKYGGKKHYLGASSSSRHQSVVPLWLVVALAAGLVIGYGVYRQRHHATMHNNSSSSSNHQGSADKGSSSLATESVESKDSKPAIVHRVRPKNLPPPTSLLTPEEDKRLERDHDGTRYHLVFSTDCSSYQHWQSYLVYYTAMKVRQPGHVTRIASGCSDEEAEAMKSWFDSDVAFMSPRRFHLQLTPHFSDVKDADGNTIGDYKFFNKPFGLKYWMEQSPQLRYDATTQQFPKDVESDIVILIDPDMGLLRPITRDFRNDRETVITPHRRDHIVTRTVEKGKPAAQVYGFGAQWARLDLEKVAGPGTPAAKVAPEDAQLYYPVGPPYLAVVTDMHNIAIHWSAFVPNVHQQYPHLLAEMFAFCIAAAHLQLPHQLVSSLMISDVGSGAEGWPLVAEIPPEEVCEFAANINHTQYAVPNVVHLCQRHAVGSDWFFAKRRVPADVFECESPLWQDPPKDLATAYDYQLFPKGAKKDLSKSHAAQTAFVLCYVYSILNEAAAFYKKNACEPKAINLQKTRNLAQMTLHGETLLEKGGV